jgi:serine/threonine protein kinase
MSPELLNPDKFGLKDSRSTKESDIYALGMVIYEVLSGRAPFTGCTIPVVILKVMEGERPGRPQGARGAWFTDDLWDMLELCWKPQPDDRPSLGIVLQCLEGVTRPSRSPSPVTTNEDVGNPLDFTVTNPGMFPSSSKASDRPPTTFVA